MKHFRIIEIKSTDGKSYMIQYLKYIFFELYYWKYFSKKSYNKYEDALIDIKKVIKQEDYETSKIGYHYIDAYKIFKNKQSTIKTIKVTK
jgi:hypothetical protein